MSDWKEWPEHCIECGYEKPTFEDPRTPPMELGDEVLCRDCYIMSINDCLEEVQCSCESYRNILAELGEPIGGC